MGDDGFKSGILPVHNDGGLPFWRCFWVHWEGQLVLLANHRAAWEHVGMTVSKNGSQPKEHRAVRCLTKWQLPAVKWWSPFIKWPPKQNDILPGKLEAG